MITDENNQTLLELQGALTEATATPPPPPDPKLAFIPLTAAQAKALPPDVVKRINDRGAVLTGRATAVANAQRVVTKIVGDALQRVQKMLNG